MTYLMAFLGLICVAVILTTSPLVIRLFEYLFPMAEGRRAASKAASLQKTERSEIREEIRRLTAVLETERRGAGR